MRSHHQCAGRPDGVGQAAEAGRVAGGGAGYALDSACRPRSFTRGGRSCLRAAALKQLAGKEERQGERELRRKVAELERALGPETYELEIAGKALAGWE